MPDNYAQILTGERLRKSSRSGRDLTLESLSDKGRILMCTAFRRLQTKAQVFSLEQNAGVRTRLTHTLEVSLFGELIANKIADVLVTKTSLPIEKRAAFVNTVQNACLLHDIGNPPFGHLGEFAIRQWFDSHREELQREWKANGVTAPDIEKYYPAFDAFDGNPQGLRIIGRLQWLSDEWGLNLTKSLIATLAVKYLGPRSFKGPFGKKVGFFEPERDHLIGPIWTSLGLGLNGSILAKRHPLVFIMEAADDIAYSISDIEDAIEKGVLNQNSFIDKIPTELKRYCGDLNRIKNERWLARNAEFLVFKTNLANYLVEAAANTYIENEQSILKGVFDRPLLDADSTASIALKFFKDFAKDNIYSCPEAVNVELSGFHIIQKLLDGYKLLLLLSGDEFARLIPEAAKPPAYGELSYERRIFSLLPKRHLTAYRYCVDRKVCPEIVARAHLIVDYVSGMTDGHALRVFRTLSGSSEVTYS